MFRFLRFIIEVLGWLQIVVVPLIVSAGIGFLVYNANPTTSRIIIALAIVLVGLITGIVLATRVWKKTGTTKYLSRISETPDMYEDEEKSK
jgi:disulfide bond formation protein DsbB